MTTADDSARETRSRSQWWGRLESTTVWLILLALVLPLGGTAWVWLYGFSTPGSHWSYVGIGSIAAMAAMLTGILAGFILGVPKLVSSGQLRVADGTPSPNTNLGEISDWITKLLLGAGLVSLSHLGGPVGRLIDNVASGLYDATSNPAGAAGAPGVAVCPARAQPGSQRACRPRLAPGLLLFGFRGDRGGAHLARQSQR